MAARNSSAPAAHPLHQDSVAAPNSPLLAADPLHQAAVANPNSPVLAANPVHQASAAASSGMYGAPGALPTEQGSLTVLPPLPPPQGAPVMKTVQGVNMMVPTPLQGPPVMQGANTVVPMPLRELVMTVPLQGRPVMAPLPFPAGPPSMMAPPSFYDVASPMTVQQPPHAGYMMGQPLLRASPPPMAALHLPQAVHMVAQPPLPAGPPPLRRRRPDYFDMPFGPRMTGFELEMAGFDESMGLPYGPYINNEMPSVGSYEPRLPSDASNTLHVEGFPPNCTRRELALFSFVFYLAPFSASAP
ncbi:SH3 domain-containing protein C23A1.17-like [Triticum dicoccoides]|uniref:SH3 domain-containing protein C23A1.17-like n=1 Tax=Triticum dicoccoides TaxID=85692 RepID=UPI001890B919|nr:SH3 domain-containing protein C23A1.17-like [Triticum dicoccoides]